MENKIAIEVRDGGLGTERPRTVVGTIERVPRDRAGYQVVRYKGQNYILRGGIRTEHFISLDNPLKRPDYTVRKYGDNYGLFSRGSLVESGIFASRKTAEKYKQISENERRARLLTKGDQHHVNG